MKYSLNRIDTYRLFMSLALIFVFLTISACNSVTTELPTEPQMAATEPPAQPTSDPSSTEAVSRPSSPIKAPETVAQSPIATPTPHPTPFVATAEATARVSAEITVDNANQLQPNSDSALIVGRLIDEATGTSAPYVYAYLSKVIGPDAKPLVALDRGDAQLSISNENGIFYFDNTPPGKYGIVVWSPVGSYLLEEPGTDYSLLFEVDTGETKNLGDLISIIP